MEQPSEAQQRLPSLKPAAVAVKPKPKKKPARKEKRFKLTRFDHDLALLVKQGVCSVPEILEKMAVDPEDFNKRVARLVRKGFFVFDSQTRSTLKLGWQGYNLFAPAKKQEKKPEAEERLNASEAELKPAGEGKLEIVEVREPRKEEREAKPEMKMKEETQIFRPPVQPPAVQILPAPQTTEDLADLLRRGAAQNPQK